MKPPNVPPFRTAATEVSGVVQSEQWNFTGLPWLARLSLFLVAVLTLGRPSCLITDSPGFPETQRFGPYLRVLTPQPDKVIVRDQVPGTVNYVPIKIQVEVYVPAGEKEIWYDFRIDERQYSRRERRILTSSPDAGITGQILDLSYSFDSMVWKERKGCHSLTLTVVGTEGEATATWWLDVDDDGTNLMRQCPGTEAVPASDGGVTSTGSPAL